jgi:hypothetical protein
MFWVNGSERNVFLFQAHFEYNTEQEETEKGDAIYKVVIQFTM